MSLSLYVAILIYTICACVSLQHPQSIVVTFVASRASRKGCYGHSYSALLRYTYTRTLAL